MSPLLQVGLLYGTFPSGSLLVLVGDRSEIGLGLLNRLLLVGLLSRGREYRHTDRRMDKRTDGQTDIDSFCCNAA